MLLIIFALIIHIYVNYVTNKRIIHNKNLYRKPLYDIIHNNLSDISHFKYYTDVLAFVFFVPLIMSKNMDALKCFCKIAAIIIIIRSFALISTDIPRSDIKCNQYELNSYNLLFGHCYDKMFSGHVSLTLLAIFVANSHNIINYKQTIVYIFAQILYGLFIIMTKNHYTVDVIISYFITMPLFYCLYNSEFFMQQQVLI